MEIKPSVSQMILRASSYVPPSAEYHGSGGLPKDGYEVVHRDPAKRKPHCIALSFNYYLNPSLFLLTGSNS